MKVRGIKCPQCWDCIYSASRHDYRNCFCGYCFVDGGTEFRWGWGNGEWPRPWVKPTVVRIDTGDYVRGGLR
jgi:hypothetical protein